MVGEDLWVFFRRVSLQQHPTDSPSYNPPVRWVLAAWKGNVEVEGWNDGNIYVMLVLPMVQQ